MSGVASRLGAVQAAIDDRVSPIVLKELRQSVRSRSVIAVLLLLLTGLVLLTGMYAIFEAGAIGTNESGLELFGILNTIVLLVCALFVPLYGAIRTAQERTGIAADLLHTTTIGPAAMIWGKVAVAMLISVLLLSVAAPFMALTYLFRGIDLPTIAFFLVADLLIVLAVVQVGVFLGALPVGSVSKVLAALVLVPILFGLLLQGGGSLLFMFGFGVRSVTQIDADGWIGIAAVAGVGLGIIGLLFTLAVGVTAPRSANRSLLPRVYTTAFVLVTLAGVLFLIFEYDSPEPLVVWGVVWTLVLSAAIALSASERRALGPRIRRGIPGRAILRVLPFLYTSGAASGLCWSVLLAAFVLVVGFGGGYLAVEAWGAPGDLDQAFASVGLVPVYALGYTLWGITIRDGLLKRWVGESSTAPIGLALAGVASAVPFFIAFGLEPSRFDQRRWFLVSNPFGIAMSGGSSVGSSLFVYCLIGASVLVCIGLALNARWLLRQIRGFAPPATRPPDPLTTAPQTDRPTAPAVIDA
ncbi:MAG: hypothetical protein AAGI30_00655 [Planctomycetota bacterium]